MFSRFRSNPFTLPVVAAVGVLSISNNSMGAIYFERAWNTNGIAKVGYTCTIETVAMPDELQPRFFSAEHMGNTIPVSYSAVLVALEALARNDANTKALLADGKGLSIVDLVLEYGKYMKREDKERGISVDNFPIPLLHAVAEKRRLGVTTSDKHTHLIADRLNQKLRDHAGNCKLADHQECLRKIVKDSELASLLDESIPSNAMSLSTYLENNGMDLVASGISKTESALFPLKELTKNSRARSRIDLPQYRVKTWDLFESQEDLVSTLVQAFQNNPNHPVIVHACYNDHGERSCKMPNVMALTGVEVITCKNPSVEKSDVYYNGIFRTSVEVADSFRSAFETYWSRGSSESNGAGIEKYRLEPLALGMFKHQFGFAKLNPCNGSGCTPILEPVQGRSYSLFHAAHIGDQKLVKDELSQNQNVNRTLMDDTTPLYMAAQYNHEEVVRSLLAAGANPNVKAWTGATTLMVATYNKGHKVMRSLLDSKAEVNAEHDQGGTALSFAAKLGDAEAVKILTESKADVNYEDKDSHTPLVYAALKGNVPMVEHLLNAGAKVNPETRVGLTPAHAASSGGHMEVLRTLVQAGADVAKPTKGGSNCLHCAVEGGHRGIVNFLRPYLARAKVDINTKSESGDTPLFFAAQNGKLGIFKELRDAGADLKIISSRDGYTVLITAVENGHLPIVEEILETIENWNPQDKAAFLNLQKKNDGATALFWAAQEGHVEIVQALVGAGANLEVPHQSGATPLYVAVQNSGARDDKYSQIVRILLKAGANTEAQVNAPIFRGPYPAGTMVVTPSYLARDKGRSLWNF